MPLFKTIKVCIPGRCYAGQFSRTFTCPDLNIDCGGYDNYTASDGTVWMADRYFSGGQQLYTGYPVGGTPDPLLFRTARVGYYGGLAMPSRSQTANTT